VPESVDPEVAKALENPRVLAAINQQRLADRAVVDAVINNYTQAAQQTAEAAAAVVLGNITSRPELQGIPAAQLPGALAALARTDPVAHAEIQGQINSVRALAQQATEARQAQQQRAVSEFQAQAKLHDDAFEKFVANEPPETVRAVKEYAHQMLKDAGATPEELAFHWANNPAFRSSWAQQIIYDAAKFRMAKANIPKAAARPVPLVQKPGSSVDRVNARDRDYFALEGRYRGPLNPKQAAELVIARRARAGG
jgi:hypothetical protein